MYRPRARAAAPRFLQHLLARAQSIRLFSEKMGGRAQRGETPVEPEKPPQLATMSTPIKWCSLLSIIPSPDSWLLLHVNTPTTRTRDRLIFSITWRREFVTCCAFRGRDKQNRFNRTILHHHGQGNTTLSHFRCTLIARLASALI